jgi:S-adenosylmethionine:tRNA ribosyltransferase-isomerase
VNRLSDYDYHLPPELIAQTPLPERDSSRLLKLNRETGVISHHTFRECVEMLRPGDLLVVNDTRVTARRVFGSKATGGKVELLLLHFDPTSQEWLAMAKPGRRLQPGAVVALDGGGEAIILSNASEGLKRVSVEADVNRLGEVPLPPYITARLTDDERYQTTYATAPGSAAAPTAGLHFTRELLKDLHSAGVNAVKVTLDVSIDTFRPIQSEDLSEHKMHGETCRISPAAAATINSAKGRVIAVGTTAVRTLESFAIGPKMVKSGEMRTSIFIQPGYEFQVIDGMFTNFHMPRTSMLVMLSALAGRESIMQAYAEAIDRKYRFLSFGDSMLIL